MCTDWSWFWWPLVVELWFPAVMQKSRLLLAVVVVWQTWYFQSEEDGEPARVGLTWKKSVHIVFKMQTYSISYLEGTVHLHCYTSCALTTLHCSKMSFFRWCPMKRYNNLFRKMWQEYWLLWDTVCLHFKNYMNTFFFDIRLNLPECVSPLCGPELLTTPLTDSSWSPLFSPPWRSATPPGITLDI